MDYLLLGPSDPPLSTENLASRAPLSPDAPPKPPKRTGRPREKGLVQGKGKVLGKEGEWWHDPWPQRDNRRKFLILGLLTHFEPQPMTPKELAIACWEYSSEEWREGRTLANEWFRFRRACQRLADSRWYTGSTYLRAAGKHKNQTRYRLTAKGRRVYGKMLAWRLPGWNPILLNLPEWGGARKVDEPADAPT